MCVHVNPYMLRRRQKILSEESVTGRRNIESRRSWNRALTGGDEKVWIAINTGDGYFIALARWYQAKAYNQLKDRNLKEMNYNRDGYVFDLEDDGESPVSMITETGEVHMLSNDLPQLLSYAKYLTRLTTLPDPVELSDEAKKHV